MVETSATGRKSASDVPSLNFSGLLNTSGVNAAARASGGAGTTETGSQSQKKVVPENIKTYKAVFRDAYNFLEKYSTNEPDIDGEYWDGVNIDFCDLSQKYAENDDARAFATAVITAVYTELERAYKRINGEDDTMPLQVDI